ncbi:MAG: hypothetical protein IH582_10075, partial [Afipia sp.]|nr:hypothetical protein [Afipia sp.]
EQAFREDHDWSKGLRPGSPTDFVPRRAAFGLPQNYKDVYSVTAPTISRGGKNVDLDRRASPLLFHVHKIGPAFHPVALFLPTRFTPSNKVTIKRNAGGARMRPAADYDFPSVGRAVIDDYLDARSRKSGATTVPPYFPAQIKIYP